MEDLIKLKTYLESKIDLNFDFDVEHWNNGNFDDSFEYGTETGEEWAYRDLLVKVNKLIKGESI